MEQKIQKLQSKPSISYEKALELKNETVWTSLANISVISALELWFSTLTKLTRKTYMSGMTRLIELQMLDPSIDLQKFSLINHNSIVDQIKLVPAWSEATKQSRAACYISFTGFLSRRTEGLIKKSQPSREGASKTFFKVREKVTTNAMTRSQWISFFDHLETLNPRDALAGKVMLQGGKRISEALGIKTKDIAWDKNQIRFAQKKTKGYEKYTVITYSSSIMNRIKELVNDQDGYVFVTRNGRRLANKQLERNFIKAGILSGISFRITPHVLRTSAVTYLKSQGFSDSEIMKVTGHASAEMVHAYDKTSLEDNVSRKVNLIE